MDENKATAHARKMLKKQMRNSGVWRVDVPRPSPASSPMQVFTNAQPVANALPPNKRRTRTVGVRDGADNSHQARFIEENIRFVNAPDRKSQLVAISRMWATAMEALGIECPMIEAPGAAMAQLSIAEALAGKTPRLYQAVKQEPGKALPRYPFFEWAALHCLLLCAHIVQRSDDEIAKIAATDEKAGFNEALKTVIRDTEADLGCQLDRCLTGRIGSTNKGTDTRQADLLRRLRDARTDLSDPTSAVGQTLIGRWYRDDSKRVGAETSAKLRELNRYEVTRMEAVNLLAALSDDSDDLIKPKGGKGRSEK